MAVGIIIRIIRISTQLNANLVAVQLHRGCGPWGKYKTKISKEGIRILGYKCTGVLYPGSMRVTSMCTFISTLGSSFKNNSEGRKYSILL